MNAMKATADMAGAAAGVVNQARITGTTPHDVRFSIRFFFLLLNFCRFLKIFGHKIKILIFWLKIF